MTKIYTKSGDKGETGTVDGKRLKKSETMIDIYGEVDELNSTIGLIVSALDKNLFKDAIVQIERIQSELFNLGSNLACSLEKRLEYKLPQITSSDVTKLEEAMDLMDKNLSELKNFILPGGHLAASFAHLARSVCRRVERKMVGQMALCPDFSIQYINRLSDYFFVLARFINASSGNQDKPWIKPL